MDLQVAISIAFMITGIFAGIFARVWWLMSGRKKAEEKRQTNAQEIGASLNPQLPALIEPPPRKLSPNGTKHWTDFWWQEDQLINHRLTWLGVVEALLVAAYGASIELELGLEARIITLGMATSIIIFFGVLGAIRAQFMILSDYGLRYLGVSFLSTILGWVPALLLPLMFVATWFSLWIDPPVSAPEVATQQAPSEDQ